MRLTRRRLITAGVALMGNLAAPAVMGQARPHVVIIGGGAGGASLARKLISGSSSVAVTLIEANPVYTTCFMSNHYLGGLRSLESLQFGYDGLAAAGVRIVHDLATRVDLDARKVHVSGGQVFGYDRLVLSPGVAFRDDAVPGWTNADAEVMPHAFRAGAQTELLLRQIDAMPPGGLFAMVAPPDPYRCPPGPYERVCMIAHRLAQTNPTAKILVLDPKDHFSKQSLFEDAWGRLYGGMIDRIDPDFGGADVEVRPASMEIVVDGEVQPVDVCNVIPAQRAGDIATIAGVTDETGWATVTPQDLRSVVNADVFVLGDSCEPGEMPKSAYTANSQAQVVAMALLADLAGGDRGAVQYSNICWSLLAPDDAVKVGARYEIGPDGLVSADPFISALDESAASRAATYRESLDWYAAITAEMFG
jgi:sulfide dehydrogenase [flavocytochrome c] flavoprotein chain